MKKGDKLNFKKFYWEIVKVKPTIYGGTEYRYRVIRKYFRGFLKLKYTKKDYEIKDWRWRFLKNKLKNNPSYHYNISLWSNNNRI